MWGGESLPTYELIDNGDHQLSSWKITSGQFAGVVYFVGDVGFSGNVLRFTTDVIDNPNGVDVESDLFTSVAGAILEGFLREQTTDCNNWLYRKG
ncbi:hypothetical protein NVP1244A_170 [Vibrio phage 1.244.A._10N.261.54.C3]|nr:hypothetical protein NVP1244A_170 [Vibrio phage 1.244.A._10N.261.54.C3]AUR98798.1 hypothetical protein NVP1255O_170 [Vibrio phage 1.255.O._10N.286.45.F1]